MLLTESTLFLAKLIGEWTRRVSAPCIDVSFPAFQRLNGVERIFKDRGNCLDSLLLTTHICKVRYVVGYQMITSIAIIITSGSTC